MKKISRCAVAMKNIFICTKLTPPVFIGQNREQRTSPKFDILGISLLYYVSQHVLVAQLVGPITILINLDPLYFIFQAYVPAYLINRLDVQMALILIRLIFTTWGFFEMIRPVIITVVFSLVGLHTVNESISLVGQQRNVKVFVQFYELLAIAFVYIHQVIEPILTVFMSYGTFLVVILSFGMLRGFGYIPMPLYLIFPSGLTAAYAIIAFAFPRLIKIHVDTCGQVDRWIKACFKRREKYLGRKLMSLKPLAVHTGFAGVKLFEVRRGTSNTFYSCILDYTNSLLVSVPEEYLSA